MVDSTTAASVLSKLINLGLTGKSEEIANDDVLLVDMAAWGARHVFGNVERHRRQPTDPLPFLPLEEMYIEPDGVQEIQESAGGKAASEQDPILGLLERFFEDTRAKVVIVKADFGSGKSLTARTLASRWAERYLTELTPASDRILPVFIRCADDFPGEGFDLAQVVRRAYKRQAEDFEFSLKLNDPAFAMPADEQRTVFLLDGLDEVALGARLLESLFDRRRAGCRKLPNAGTACGMLKTRFCAQASHSQAPIHATAAMTMASSRHSRPHNSTCMAPSSS